jgi:hypothetical protein
VAWRAVPLERLHDPVRRFDLGEAPFESVVAVVGMLDEPPMPAP